MVLKLGAQALEKRGCNVQVIDAQEFNLPVYDEDFETEKGVPEGAKQMALAMKNAHAVWLASPEYNGGISGSLKNTLDWISRADVSAFSGKVFWTGGAAAGWAGATKSLLMLRLILTHLGSMVIPSQVNVPQCHKAFNEDGTLKDAVFVKQIEDGADQLLRMIS